MKKLKLEKFICLFNGMKSDLIKTHENSIKLNEECSAYFTDLSFHFDDAGRQAELGFVNVLGFGSLFTQDLIQPENGHHLKVEC